MKRARIATLHAVAKHRQPGYLEIVLKTGKISRDGQWMIFEDAAHAKIRLQYKPHRSISLPVNLGKDRAENNRIGLGDALHKIAGPIGKAIHWPCLKNDGTTQLKPGSPCARARRTLNKVQF